MIVSDTIDEERGGFLFDRPDVGLDIYSILYTDCESLSVLWTDHLEGEASGSGGRSLRVAVVTGGWWHSRSSHGHERARPHTRAGRQSVLRWQGLTLPCAR